MHLDPPTSGAKTMGKIAIVVTNFEMYFNLISQKFLNSPRLEVKIAQCKHFTEPILMHCFVTKLQSRVLCPQGRVELV